MSATIGTLAARTISLSAAVDSTSGQDTRMMSAPASSQRRIWSIVAFASEVGVLVIVCTVTGASPPTATLPTMIWRDWRRRIVRHGRIADMRAHIVADRSRANPIADSPWLTAHVMGDLTGFELGDADGRACPIDAVHSRGAVPNTAVRAPATVHGLPQLQP